MLSYIYHKITCHKITISHKLFTVYDQNIHSIKIFVIELQLKDNYNYQWYGNSQSYRTLSDKCSECPVN